MYHTVSFTTFVWDNGKWSQLISLSFHSIYSPWILTGTWMPCHAIHWLATLTVGTRPIDHTHQSLPTNPTPSSYWALSSREQTLHSFWHSLCYFLSMWGTHFFYVLPLSSAHPTQPSRLSYFCALGAASPHVYWLFASYRYWYRQLSLLL